MPHILMLLGVLLLIWREQGLVFRNFSRNELLNDSNKLENVSLILLMTVGSLLSWSWNLPQGGSAFSVFPYFLLIPISMLGGTVMQRRDVKILAWLLAIECIIASSEFALGVNGFTLTGGTFKLTPTDEMAGDLLYYRRVFGLSHNSSALANKILVITLLLDFFNLYSKRYMMLRVIFLVALVFTFNRTTMGVMAFYLLFKVVSAILFRKDALHRNAIVSFGFGLVVFAVMVWGVAYLEEILSQLTRNRGQVDLSGREEIWSFFIEHISSNFFFGSGSSKLLMNNDVHAHNSFLQHVATHGILLSSLMLWLILRNMRYINMLPVIAFIIYSLTQYGILWGVSLMDLAFFGMLFQPTLKSAHQGSERVSLSRFR